MGFVLLYSNNSLCRIPCLSGSSTSLRIFGVEGADLRILGFMALFGGFGV